MTDKWEVITDPERLFNLKKQGCEIEIKLVYGEWSEWMGNYWHTDWQFRARPAKPKTRTVTYECFDVNGHLAWIGPDESILKPWKRVPSEDKTVEVEEP